MDRPRSQKLKLFLYKRSKVSGREKSRWEGWGGRKYRSRAFKDPRHWLKALRIDSCRYSFAPFVSPMFFFPILRILQRSSTSPSAQNICRKERGKSYVKNQRTGIERLFLSRKYTQFIRVPKNVYEFVAIVLHPAAYPRFMETTAPFIYASYSLKIFLPERISVSLTSVGLKQFNIFFFVLARKARYHVSLKKKLD